MKINEPLIYNFLLATKKLKDPELVTPLVKSLKIAVATVGIVKWDWFFIQCFYESAFFTRQKENLYYTTLPRLRRVFGSRIPEDNKEAKLLLRNPDGLADVVYKSLLTGKIKGLRGRDLIGEDWLQITGESNKQAIGDFLNINIWKKGNRLSDKKNMFLGSAVYWLLNDIDHCLSFKDCNGKITGKKSFTYEQRVKFLNLLYKKSKFKDKI